MEARAVLTAVLLADSFTQVYCCSTGNGVLVVAGLRATAMVLGATPRNDCRARTPRPTHASYFPITLLQRFRPITVERPKALLPLVNIPMIEYALEWLAMNGVEEVRSPRIG